MRYYSIFDFATNFGKLNNLEEKELYSFFSFQADTALTVAYSLLLTQFAVQNPCCLKY